MLWYKAWMETRVRFLLCLAGMAGLCAFIVYHGDHEALSYTKLAYYYYVLRSAHSTLCFLWVPSVTLLLMGGLLREKAAGTAGFTLALPVSRARLMAVRICLTLIQSVALAVVPWGAMYLTARMTGKADSLAQVWFHLVLLIGGGMVFYAVALLTSSLVQGEYTAPVASLGVVAVLSIVLADGPLRALSPMAFINGLGYYDRFSGLLTGSIPWAQVAFCALFATLLIAISIKVIERREF